MRFGKLTQMIKLGAPSAEERAALRLSQMRPKPVQDPATPVRQENSNPYPLDMEQDRKFNRLKQRLIGIPKS